MPTVEAIYLLGWLEKDDAVKLLKEQCVFDPPLSDERAEELWQAYRNRVEALPERPAMAPTRLVMNTVEREASRKFQAHQRRIGRANVLDVIKIDPMQLVVHQLGVVLDQTRNYSTVGGLTSWLREALPASEPPPTPIQIQHGVNTADAAVPHAEFVFLLDQSTGGFRIVETARYVSTTAFASRLLLGAGYHRSFARASNMVTPEPIERSLVVALTSDHEWVVSPTSPNQGVRAMVLGLRPPLFGDFFDDRLFCKVHLRKKRFELHIRATVQAIDVGP